MALQLDAAKTGLVLIDLQKGVLGNSLAPYNAAQVIENAVLLMRKFVAVKAPIFKVHVGFSADGADRLSQETDAPMNMPPGGFPANFMEFVEQVAEMPATVTILKRNWSAFYGTELDLQMRRRGIETMVLGGVSTNIGVESTAREGYQLGYSTVVAEDCCSSMGAEMHAFSMQKIMPRLARVRSTAEILAALG